MSTPTPSDTSSRPPHPDLAWLGLEPGGDGGRWRFELAPGLTRLDGQFYGGTGVAVATALMEAATGRAALWVTVQYVASAATGEQLDCRVEVLAQGRRTSQVGVRAVVGERTVLSAVGATGDRRPGGVDAQFGAMPDVGPPDQAMPWERRLPVAMSSGDGGWMAIMELREVERPGAPALWARMRHMRHTRATLGFVADMVPMGVMAATGRAGAGTSLDNAIRYGPSPDTEWVLVDLEPHMADGGYVHGAARLWAPDGTLLAVASQTARAIVFD